MKKRIMAFLLAFAILTQPAIALADDNIENQAGEETEKIGYIDEIEDLEIEEFNFDDLDLFNDEDIDINIEPIEIDIDFDSIKSPIITGTEFDGSNVVSSSDAKIPTTLTGEQFVKVLGKEARRIGQEEDIYASVMIAQACLETGFGSSGLNNEPYNNLFGIKGSYKGKSVSMKTWEEYSGEAVNIVDSFKAYPSYKESMEDYANLMVNGISGNSDFYKGALKSRSSNYKEATSFLTGKYATDSQYASKLNKIIESYDLTKYDNPLYIDIKKHDKENLTSISESTNISVEKLLELNPSIKDEDKIIKKDKRIILDSDYHTENFVFPLKLEEYSISSGFGFREDPTGYSGNYHGGIDIPAETGTPVYAANNGIVIETGTDPSAGNFVIVQHDNGLLSYYFHLSAIKTKADEKVNSKTVIGNVGSTGNSTGPHLHFAMGTNKWKNFINPKLFVEIDEEA